MYAPIIIPTLCRYEHFVRLIESLRRNSYAKYTDVYIGLDFPSSENHVDGYRKICRYLEGEFVEFKSLNVIKRQENYGAGRNLRDLTEYVLTKYDRFIKADDDLEFSPNFLEYMNKCLDKYEDDEDIVAVSGYSYPIAWNVSKCANVFKSNFSFPMWGTGFWKRKYNDMARYIRGGGLFSGIDSFITSDKFNCMSIAARCEYINLCVSGLDISNNLALCMSDVAARIYLAKCNKKILYPVFSKVRNLGFDGSGLYCKKISGNLIAKNAGSYNYHSQSLDNVLGFELIEDEMKAIDTNRILYDKFDARSIDIRLKSKLKLLIYRLMGPHFLREIINHNNV